MNRSAAIWPSSLVGLGFATLLLAAWLNPTRHLPWPGFYSELPAAMAAAMLVVAAYRRSQGAQLRWPRSAWLCLGLSVVAAAQWLGGLLPYAGDAFVCFVYLVGAAACVACGATGWSPEDPDRATRLLAWMLVIAGIGSTAIALQQWFGQADWSEWIAEGRPGTRVDANIGQANHFASLLMFAMLGASYLATLGRLGRGPLALVLGFLTIGLALSQSRTPWLVMAVMAAWALARRDALFDPLRLRVRTLGLLLAWYSLLFWASFVLPEPLLLAEKGDAIARLESGGRGLLWSQTLEAIRLSPWVGYGWLQGQTAQAAAALTKPGLEYSSYAHNLVLDLMVWNGVPLGLLLSGLLAWWYFRRGLKASGAADSFRFGVLTVFAVHSMLEYPFAYAYFLVPVALLAGQLEASEAPPAISARRATLCRAGFIGCAVACTALVVSIARDYVLAEADRREVQMVMLRIGGVRPFPPVPDFWVLDQLEAATRNARVAVRPGMPAAELDDLLTVTRRYPGAYFLRMSAAALALHGREAEGLDQLRRLRGLHGERQFQAALTALNEMSTDKGWPLAGWLATAARLP